MRALCLVLGASAACTSTAGTAPTGSLGGVAGIEEIEQGLADLSSQCTFDAGTGVMTLALEAADIAWLSVGIGNTIEVNNLACGAATVSTTKRIDIAEASSGDQTVIVDARTGSLGLGRATGVGLTVALGSGNDQFKLIGTSGADRIVVGASGIALGADPNLDYTLAGVESVTINGDVGNDTISGAGDTVTGAAYPDPLLLYGGEGTDSLRGGAGDDHCWGGDGDDTFLGGPADDGADIFTGGPGRDTADYSARTANLSLSLDDVANDGANAEGDNIENDVEVVKGGSGADTNAGGANADTFYGGAGNDTLSGGGGADTLYGEAGDDMFVEAGTASGADAFIGGTGTDTIEYARTGGVTIALDGTATSGAPGEGDTVDPSVENAIGGAGNDTLRGNTGANLLDGGGGNDTIFGGAGNDTLLGGSGINTLNGEAGDDRFPQGPNAVGDDTIVGGAGFDTADYSERTDDLTVVCDATTASGSAGEGDRIGIDVEHVVGGAGDDTLIGNAADNQLEGGAGVDALYGLAGDDVLDGDAGADALDCGAGDADIALDTTTTILLSCEL